MVKCMYTDVIVATRIKGESHMTEELIKEVKHIQQCLVNKDMTGEEWEEKMEIIRKLEDVSTYLKDALGRGIEF